MSLILSNVKDTQKKDDFWLKNIEINYSSEDKNPHCHNEDGNMKDLQQTLNPMNDFILSLVMSYLGSRIKVLIMY